MNWPNATVKYQTYLDYIVVQCNGDPLPTVPPLRDQYLGAPDYLHDPTINTTVKGTPGYDAFSGYTLSGGLPRIPLVAPQCIGWIIALVTIYALFI